MVVISMAWYDDLNNQVASGAFTPATPKPKQVASPAKKKDFWTDQISTGGGIGGALGGAAAGAALGSVVPVIGTAIGGIAGGILGGALGSGAGEFTENAVTGEKDLFKNVGQEALLGGVFSAPPLKLARGIAAASKAGTGGAKLAFEQAVAGTAKNATGKTANNFVQNVANKTYAQAFNLPRRFTGKLKPEETAQALIKYGVGGGLDNIENTSVKALSTLGGILDNSVTKIGGDVKVGDVSGVFKNLEKYNIPKGELQALRTSITDIGTTGRNLGYENPSRLLDKIRELEKRGYDLVKAGETNLSKNPNSVALGDAYLQSAKELEDNLYGAITSKGTVKALQTEANQAALNGIAKGLGDEFMKITDPKEIRTLMQPFVRARQLTTLTRDEAQSAGTNAIGGLGARGAGGGAGALAGFGLGGPVGAAVGGIGGFLGAPLVRGAQEAVQAPVSTTVGRALGSLGGKLPSGAGSAGPVGGLGAVTARQTIGQNTFGNQGSQQPTLDEALLQNSLSGVGTAQPQQMQQPQETSPYGRENLLYDIQRDPQNADQYIAYYQQLQEVFGPSQQALSQSNQSALASADNADNTLSQLEQLYQTAGGGSGRIAGAIQNVAGSAGLDKNASVYNSLAQASVTQIAKALAGSGAGTVSDADARVIIAALPTLQDSPEEAQAKFSALKQRLQAARQNTLYYGQGGTGGTDLQSALLNAQGAF